MTTKAKMKETVDVEPREQREKGELWRRNRKKKTMRVLKRKQWTVGGAS